MSDTIQIIATQPRTFGERCCADLARLPDGIAEQISAQLQLLAHPIRVQILDLLIRHAGQVCVCDLEAALPVKQATVSHHLRLLRDGGLIDCERRGQWAYYVVRPAALDTVRAQIDGLLAGRA